MPSRAPLIYLSRGRPFGFKIGGLECHLGMLVDNGQNYKENGESWVTDFNELRMIAYILLLTEVLLTH